jgi:hypothetical protein
MSPLRRTSIWLEEKNLRLLEAIGKKKGGLKPAQLIRMAIQKFINKESQQK